MALGCQVPLSNHCASSLPSTLLPPPPPRSCLHEIHDSSAHRVLKAMCVLTMLVWTLFPLVWLGAMLKLLSPWAEQVG